MKKIFIFVLLLTPLSGNCCRAKLQPWDLEIFGKIVVGKVRNIQILQFEKIVINGVEEEIIAADYTRSHKIVVMVQEALLGEKVSEQTIVVGGCGVLIPEVGDEGLFFIGSDTATSVPIYKKEKELYNKWRLETKKC